ncbi:Tyrosine-protein kinase hopscotch [Armadillidium vulgare]|nr:Tyrosine-protein kinase hopscotch [Armadillidium vulgare]
MITVEFLNDDPPQTFEINENEELYIEEILAILCKKLNIRPLCQIIYGLQEINITGKNKISLGYWLPLCKKVSELKSNSHYQFRIRLVPYVTNVLRRLDTHSFSYLFYQVRHDFIAGNLREHTQKSSDALGLVVADILHYLLIHKDKKVKDLEINDFLPKRLKSLGHRINVRSTTEDLFKENSEAYFDRGPDDMKFHYLDKVDELGRAGVVEKYEVKTYDDDLAVQVDVYIDPFHEKWPGVYYEKKKQEAEHVCRIEEIVFVAIRKQDKSVEISRQNGAPSYFAFPSLAALESMVSCLSAYYRVMKSWTFNICRELPAPSLAYLRSNKCHGPVGYGQRKKFAHQKLKIKAGLETGIGILRESSMEYDTYKLSVIKKVDQPPIEYAIIENEEGKVHLKDKKEDHDNLLSLINWEIQINYNGIGLRKLIPPSDLDKAEMPLIYASKKKNEEEDSPFSIAAGEPKVMYMEHFIVIDKTPLKGKFSSVYHVRWAGRTADELAVKVPQLKAREKDDYMSCLSKFLLIKGDCVVKVYGLTLCPLSLVMEYLPLGPLNTYLKRNAKKMRQVKLGDPSKPEYSSKDIHWLPREHIMHPLSALADPNVDVWAFATTVWEIFSMGETPLAGADIEQVKALYSEGYLLSRPELCPKDLYQVMVSCWHPDPHRRKHPQVIMRDVKQIFYYTFNSRRENQYQKLDLTYATLETEGEDAEIDSADDTSTVVSEEQFSVSTQLTSLTQTDGSVTEVQFEQIMDYPLIPPEIAIPEVGLEDNYSVGDETTKSLTLKDLLIPPPWGIQSVEQTESEPSPPPIELNNCSIEIVQRIGKGNYGYVFKGKRIFKDKRVEYVALKRLVSVGNTSDFQKEMEIMKNLRHENIVQFYCLVESDQEGKNYQYMVMEYLSLGSLQDYLLTNKDDQFLTSDKKLLGFAMDIAKGMDYLESQQVIHRDLAARNVLVASADHVKITDFGLAQKPNQGNYYIIRTLRELPIRWYAIESIEKGKFSHKSDVWSYGVTLWEMFTRGLSPDLPIDGAILIQTLKHGTRLMCKAPCKHFIYSRLIRPCWDEDPSMRPEFTRIMSVISELSEEIE